jgi:DNA polymerase (family 10)
MCRALEDPSLTVVGHMTGRLLLARDGYAIDQHEVIRQAAKHRVAIEINANPRRLDLDWRLVGFALEQGCKITIGPDAHIIEGLDDTLYGLRMARKGGATARDILNCISAEEFLKYARRT